MFFFVKHLLHADPFPYHNTAKGYIFAQCMSVHARASSSMRLEATAAAEATVGRGHALPAAFKRVSCIGGVLRLPNE